MKFKIMLQIALFALSVVTYASSGVYEGCYYETADRISIVVSGHAYKNSASNNLVYSYALKSNPQSEQTVWRLDIILPEKDVIISATAPNGWEASWSGKPLEISREAYEITGIKPRPENYRPEIRPPYMVGWSAKPAETEPEDKFYLKPSETISGLAFTTSYGLPGIVDYYAEGDAPLPKCPEGGAVDTIPGYDDLTPYGPGLVGRTLGPTAPPEELKPVDFLNNIISMKHEAFKLGWIASEAIELSLDQKLDAALKKLQSGNNNTARNILKAFINEVEAQGCETYEGCKKGKHLKPEAYALLKYNVQYLVDNLK